MFENRREQLLLAAEVVIEHALVRFGAPGDLIDTGAEQATTSKFLSRRQQNPAPGALGITFDFQLVHGGLCFVRRGVKRHATGFPGTLHRLYAMDALCRADTPYRAVMRKALRLWHMACRWQP